MRSRLALVLVACQGVVGHRRRHAPHRLALPSRPTLESVSAPEWLPPPPPAPSEDETTRRPRRSWVFGAIVTLVVAGVIVLAGAVFLGDDEPALSGSDLADAFMVFERAIPYGNDGYADLAECPVGEPLQLTTSLVDVVDIDAVILNGDVFVDAYESGSGYPAITQCFLTSDPDDGFGATSVGFSVSGVPVGPYRDFLTDGAYDEDVIVSIEVQRAWDESGLSGDLFGYCYRASDISGCGADFVDRFNGVVLSVYLQGPERSGDEVVRALAVVVEEMARNLEAFVANNPVPATIPGVGLDT